MKILMMFGFVVLHGLSPAFAQEIEHLGSFQNVVSGDEGEHCAGYSLAIWTHRKRMFGLLDVHAGLCGDPPCGVITEFRHDPVKDIFSFTASIRNQAYRFKGHIKSGMVSGTINGKNVRLSRERETGGMQSDKEMHAWCEFWQKIPRCEGVKAMCESTKNFLLPAE